MKSKKTLYIGTGLLGFLVLVAIIAPLISPYDPNEQDLLNTLLGPGSHHWLGTDPLGRDVFTRLIYGARVDLTIGLLAVILPYLIGVSLGLLTGWLGGATDSVVMRIVDTVIAFPFYVLAIALIFVFGPGIKSIIVAITLVGWVAYSRIVRANVLVAKEQDYVHAARLTGLPTFRILRRHLLPNVISQSIVFAMSDIVLSILAIVSLGYLGLGVPVPTAEWGSMIQEGQSYIMNQWWLSTLPGLMVVYVGFSLSLIGDGLVARLER
ncbi:MAG TPA: ABC transporter permease [Candidatus Paceibacterota bacterium]|nr:ABC transporter permease [Candidatus Paceibacterota bacterium]